MKSLLYQIAPRVLVCFAMLAGGSRDAAAADENQSGNAQQVADSQDFVFLGETRPILVRLHVRLDGKPVQEAFDQVMNSLFDYLDVNRDGVLSKEEAERAPAAGLLAGSPVRGFGGGRRGPVQAGPSPSDLNADAQGNVTRAGLTAYYRKNGVLPFHFQLTPAPANSLGVAAFLGGPRPVPPAAAISEALFTLLDANHDGKLTPDELAAAPALLLKLDQDEDELVTPQELVPNANSSADPAGLMAMFAPGRPSASSKTLVPVTVSGKAPADLVRRLLERYRAKGNQSEKLNRKELGIDEATFARLDHNQDGQLDGEELAAIVKQPPDLEMVLRLGKKQKDESAIQVLKSSAGRLQVKEESARFDMGLTQVELRFSEKAPADLIGGFMAQQLGSQFKQADRDGNGFIDAKEAEGSRVFRGQFKAMDRDGDGKVTEKEMKAYFAHLRGLQARVRDASASLVLSDQSSGLFQLLDANRDGRLSVREMRNASKLLKQLDPTGKGYFVREDIPHHYQWMVRRGPSDGGNAANALVMRYFGGGTRAKAEPPAVGPLWFQKMDRNRDGDISRKEFLGSDAQFRMLDLDGDGLISLDEAEKADVRLRKQAEQGR